MKNRFVKQKFQGTELLRKFQREISEELIKNHSWVKGENQLCELHQSVSKSDINKLRLSCFKQINSLNWKLELKKYVLDDISKLLGPDLVIQNKLNLSIQMPGDESSILPAHTDCNSGDSPFQLVIWIPLTDAKATNSMFIMGEAKSRSYYHHLGSHSIHKQLEISKDDYININEGEYIIFPPTLIHGNTLNTTKKTRISLNVRVKSIFSPYQRLTPLDRKVGAYYSLWNMSPWSKWNQEVLKELNK